MLGLAWLEWLVLTGDGVLVLLGNFLIWMPGAVFGRLAIEDCRKSKEKVDPFTSKFTYLFQQWELAIIVSFHLRWKTKFFILCDVIFHVPMVALVMLRGSTNAWRIPHLQHKIYSMPKTKFRRTEVPHYSNTYCMVKAIITTRPDDIVYKYII